MNIHRMGGVALIVIASSCGDNAMTPADDAGALVDAAPGEDAGATSDGALGNDAGPISCTPDARFCDPGDLCLRGGRCKGPGTCAPEPDVCEAPSPQDEVCGCDGTLYASTCMANMAGVDTYFSKDRCSKP